MLWTLISIFYLRNYNNNLL